jgi:hypothetical protein
MMQTEVKGDVKKDRCAEIIKKIVRDILRHDTNS